MRDHRNRQTSPQASGKDARLTRKEKTVTKTIADPGDGSQDAGASREEAAAEGSGE